MVSSTSHPINLTKAIQTVTLGAGGGGQEHRETVLLELKLFTWLEKQIGNRRQDLKVHSALEN